MGLANIAKMMKAKDALSKLSKDIPTLKGMITEGKLEEAGKFLIERTGASGKEAEELIMFISAMKEKK